MLERDSVVISWPGADGPGEGCVYGAFEDLPREGAARFSADFASHYVYALYPCVGWTPIARFDGRRLVAAAGEVYERSTRAPPAVPGAPYRARGRALPVRPSARFGPDCVLEMPGPVPPRAGFYQSVEHEMFARYYGETLTLRYVPSGPRFEACEYGGPDAIGGYRVHRFHAREQGDALYALLPCTGWTRFGRFDDRGRLVRFEVPMERVSDQSARAPGHEAHFRCMETFELDGVPER